jgi:hypothetical protein
MDKVPDGLATFRLEILRRLVCLLVLKKQENPGTGICFLFAYTTDLLGDVSLDCFFDAIGGAPPCVYQTSPDHPQNDPRRQVVTRRLGVTCAATRGLPLKCAVSFVVGTLLGVGTKKGGRTYHQISMSRELFRPRQLPMGNGVSSSLLPPSYGESK